jgi:hypothetical protein
MNTVFILIIIIIFIILMSYNYLNNYLNNTTSNNVISNSESLNKNLECENNKIQNIMDKMNEYENNNNDCQNDMMNKINPEIFEKLGFNQNNNNDCQNDMINKINPEIFEKLGFNENNINESLIYDNKENLYTEPNNIHESFVVEKQNKNISFKNIKANKLYYGLPCDYIKNDCFYDSLKNNGFKMTNNILNACLIVPCSYETTEKEINDLQKNKIINNEFKDSVRIFMLNNTDHMVSKLSLWKYLKQQYGGDIASTMIPYTWDLTDPKDIELFKSQYDKNKIYITKNNYQRQEGIEIHTNLDSIITSKDKYLLVQELLQDPYLISGRKINLRVYVLYIKDNYNNNKLNIYKDGFMYYTSELFEPNNPSFKKNITTGYIDRQIYIDNPLTHMDFRKWLDNDKRELTPIEKYIKQNYNNIKLSEYVFSQIYEQLGFIFNTYEKIVGTKTDGVSFQLYGVDVAINKDLKPMVMEINKGPDLMAKDGRDRDLKLNLCTDILKSVGLLENTNNNFITIFEKVNINGNISSINNLIDN